jgi:hypothetical protein
MGSENNKGHLRNIKGSNRFSALAMGVFILVCGFLGTYLIFRGSAATSTSYGDLNSDGIVDSLDLSILLSRWNSADINADINSDGVVNALDLSVMLSHFGTSAPAAITCTKYTATTGSDTNAGSQASPFRTIQKLLDSLSAGQTGCVQDGVYSESITARTSGSAGAPITLSAVHRGGAKLNGNNNVLANAFVITGQYVNFQNFEIYGYSSAAFTAGSSGNTGINNIDIKWNDIHDIGRSCNSSLFGVVGIYMHIDNVNIEGNLFHSIGRYTAGENGCSPTNTAYEDHDHAIYVSGSNNYNIINNIFYNNQRGWSIHLYGGTAPSNNFKIQHNTFAFANPYRIGHILIGSPGLSNSNIQDNIFYQPQTAGIYVFSGPVSGVTVSKNITYGGTIINGSTSGMTLSTNFDNTDPKLVNPGLFDFHLQPTSPAIDAASSAVSQDFDSNTRPRGSGYDIGAYEYGSTSSSPIESVTSSITQGALLSGTVHWTATATAGIQSVEFWVDNTRLSLQNSPPFAFDLNTAAYNNGAHIVGVAWTDSTGTRHPASPAINVTVSN